MPDPTMRKRMIFWRHQDINTIYQLDKEEEESETFFNCSFFVSSFVNIFIFSIIYFDFNLKLY